MLTTLPISPQPSQALHLHLPVARVERLLPVVRLERPLRVALQGKSVVAEVLLVQLWLSLLDWLFKDT